MRRYKGWEGHPNNRWTVEYKGKRYRITAHELNAPLPTAEASYPLFKKWWERKRAEIDAPAIDPQEELLGRYRRQDLLDKIREGEAARHLLNLSYKPSDPPLNPHDLLVPIVKEEQSRNLDDISHFVDQLGGKPVERDKTLSFQINRFLDLERVRLNKPLTLHDYRYSFARLQQCPAFPPSMDVGAIDADTVEAVFKWLRERDGSRNTGKKEFMHFRRFVDWLSDKDLCKRPTNLWKFHFKVTAQRVKVYPTETVRQMLAELQPRLRLYALLALNTGAYGVDIGRLRWDEWRDDRIIRKRTKTEDSGSQLVNYLLWPETLEMLHKFKSKHPEYVLTNDRGKLLWRANVKPDGTVSVTDNIKRLWSEKKRPLPLGALRHVGSNLLKQSKDFRDCADLYLAHAPRSMGERHYYEYGQEHFDSALTWLRGQFFG